MNSNTFTIEFYEEETGNPIGAVSGPAARWLIENSGLIQMLLENTPNVKTLSVPVSFPSDRIQIFRKLIKGLPVGTYVQNDRYNGPIKVAEFAPLGPQEEANIQANIAAGKVPNNIQRERGRVIVEVARFLLLDDIALRQFVLLTNSNSSANTTNNATEMKRRARITRKRAAQRNKDGYTPYLNEDLIEEILNSHKNYLFGKYYETKANHLKTVLNAANIQSRKNTLNKFNKYQTKRLEELERNRKRLEEILKKTRYTNNNGYIVDKLDRVHNEYRNIKYANKPFSFTLSPHVNMLYPFLDPSVAKIPAKELERLLRSKQRKGNERYLPSQKNTLGLENLYGPGNNI
jgi:hypothetical protein